LLCFSLSFFRDAKDIDASDRDQLIVSAGRLIAFGAVDAVKLAPSVLSYWHESPEVVKQVWSLLRKQINIDYGRVIFETLKNTYEAVQEGS
jgi:hypothetical protein